MNLGRILMEKVILLTYLWQIVHGPAFLFVKRESNQFTETPDKFQDVSMLLIYIGYLCMSSISCIKQNKGCTEEYKMLNKC